MIMILLQASRRLARAPGFSAVAILMLALGIGVSTSIFSLTNSSLLRPLPVPDGERLVRVFRTAQDGDSLAHSPATFLELREAVSSFEHLAAAYPEPCNVTVGQEPPEQLPGLNVSANYFDMLGLQPFLGRSFLPGEDQPGQGAVVILTHRYWMRRFQGDAEVLGRALRINSEEMTVIGVLPPLFDLTPMWFQLDFVKPLTIWPNFSSLRSARWYDLSGRLKPGVSLAAAQAEMTALAERLAQDYPADNGGHGIRVLPLASSSIPPNIRIIYWFVTGLALLVLLIACANLASVQVARALQRSHELAVRSALGAGRWALMLPLLVESLLLALTGGAAGLLVAYWINRLMAIPSGTRTPIDGYVVIFAVVVTVLTALSFGLVPAWLATRVSTSEALKDASRTSTGSRGQGRLKAALIATQLAFAMVLLSAALTFAVGVRRTLDQDVGWQYHDLVTGVVSIPHAPFPDDASKRRFAEALRDKLRALPGVADAVVSTWIPLFDYYSREKLLVEGSEAPAGHEPLALTNAVGASFFDLLRIPLKEGRRFRDDGAAEAPLEVIINEAMARHFWPGQSALGKRIRHAEDQSWAEVIGVVGDVRMAANFNQPVSRWQVYRTIQYGPSPYYSFALRAGVPGETLERPIRREIASIHPDITIPQVGPVSVTLRTVLANNNVLIVMLAVFAGLGLLIALIGLYGVISQLTLQRRREFGVRLALGATSANVVGLILRQGCRLLLGGLVLGGLGALGVKQIYHRTLPEMPSAGLGLQLVIAIALFGAGLAACLLPARRATRIDPAEVLRSD